MSQAVNLKAFEEVCREAEVEKPAVQDSVFPCLHSFSVGLNELRRFSQLFV